MTDPLPAWHYDGITAERHAVTLHQQGDALVIAETGERVPFAALRAMGDRRDMVWGRGDGGGWRIGLNAAPPLDWATRLPWQEHHGGVIDRFGVLPAMAIGLLLAAALVAGLTFGTRAAARLVPERWELAFGDALTGDLGGRVCSAPAGQRALDRLATRLVDAGGGGAVRVRVVDLGWNNAVTLPGRQVVLFRGLIDAARSPDEVAGVLGHEIGHVANRDVVVQLIREFGISLLIGGADGGQIARTLLSNRYGRAAERAADAYAIVAMNRANISPAATAAFFGRLARAEQPGRGGAVLGYLSTHPLSEERRRGFLASVRRAPPYRAAMSPAEWGGLRAICGTAAPSRR